VRGSPDPHRRRPLGLQSRETCGRGFGEGRETCAERDALDAPAAGVRELVQTLAALVFPSGKTPGRSLPLLHDPTETL